MASFDDIGSGSITNFGEILSNVAVNTFDRMVRGMVFEMLSTNVNNFNLMNHDFMNFHMFRNAYEKEITLNTLGENAYTDGNSDATATPAQYPSYTRGNNYMEFITNTREAEKNGVLTTRLQKAGEENTNFYLDADSDEIDNKVKFTGSYLDRNSILYKTKKLMRQHKLKTIISDFHTNGVEYNGQIGSQYGESHGRNLLTKTAENGSNDYTVNGYDNPYCRVWTHHYKYDKIEKTIRANSGNLGHWANFEWNEKDNGHQKDDTKYGDGEQYDYAWRGKHNQDRRKEHSVLDPHTGLVNITPQYRRGGGKLNRHTKDCMFSIENLAWKDYDPYSFEQALSWEQRGPLGGRIMWFPPYGIEVNETASARWQTNDFIGRGEPVYTYVNSERSGNLSFIMVTDHPSSVDYASWWDDNNLIKGVDDGQGNTENDYLRYFAGCANNNNNGDGNGGDGDGGDNGVKEGKTGGLIIKPTPMTDEYIKTNPPLIEKEAIPTPEPEPPEPESVEDKNPTYVEFFVFFPNNYSGVWDKPTNQNSAVNAIAYLLGGSDAMKQDQVDIEFDINSQGFHYENGATIGYEMEKGPITTDNVYEINGYIQGGKINTKTYVPDPDKKWCYRIDHKQPYTGGNNDPKNTINQQLYTLDGKSTNAKNNKNYSDTNTSKLNLFVNSAIESHARYKDNLYSFAEVAAALYSEKILNQPNLYKYLVDCGVNVDNVNKLIGLFTNNNQKLTEILCEGAASSHGLQKDTRPRYEKDHYVIEHGNLISAVGKTQGETYTDPYGRNVTLSVNRANTILNWVRTNTVGGWDKLKKNTWDDTPKIIPVDKRDKFNVNGESAKLSRCAHCIMTFTSGSTQTSTDPLYVKQLDDVEITADRTEQPDIVGFTFIKSEQQANGQIWNYYKKDGSIPYYDQKAGSQDNYTPSTEDDVVATAQQVRNVFNTYKPIIKRPNVNNYRGTYNLFGFYFTNIDYKEMETPTIKRFVAGQQYYRHDFVYLNDLGGRIYNLSEDFNGESFEIDNYGLDVTHLIRMYKKGDAVTYNGNIYVCKNNYPDTLGDEILFTDDNWDKTNILFFNWVLMSLVDKVAQVLCMTRDTIIDSIFSEYEDVCDSYDINVDNSYDYLWKYGTPNDLMGEFNENTDIVTYANNAEASGKLSFTQDELNFLNVIYQDLEDEYGSVFTLDSLKKYISLHRVLDSITKIKTINGDRNVCTSEVISEEEMKEKIFRKDESETEGCDNIWVDRGDGLLIQECNITEDGDGRVISRFNAEKGEGDWNKLRYDQEYHFFKQYFDSHPILLEKLQEKIKYFNPAFHSMTPEGFNARCTFLQQCTRQGNTKTMSDSAGKTANNLAFGRAPYCVLRLGDFYNQMIVIESVSFDYNISNGLQWDMNPEGNGMQPMLCRVNISFKFIGGGDITGPVQRLQNAMSFNYYANTSFYDNRADRIEYQPTNWKTMGGAGNNEVNLDKSYAYIAKNYESQLNIVTHD